MARMSRFRSSLVALVGILAFLLILAYLLIERRPTVLKYSVELQGEPIQLVRYNIIYG